MNYEKGPNKGPEKLESKKEKIPAFHRVCFPLSLAVIKSGMESAKLKKGSENLKAKEILLKMLEGAKKNQEIANEIETRENAKEWEEIQKQYEEKIAQAETDEEKKRLQNELFSLSQSRKKQIEDNEFYQKASDRASAAIFE